MPAAVYTPDPVYAGDTWPGIPSISFETPPAAAVASARMVFFRSGQLPGKTAATGCELTSPDAIEITDAAEWAFAIPPRVLPLEAGEWTFHFKTTDQDGTITTWLAGVLTIL